MLCLDAPTCLTLLLDMVCQSEALFGLYNTAIASKLGLKALAKLPRGQAESTETYIHRCRWATLMQCLDLSCCLNRGMLNISENHDLRLSLPPHPRRPGDIGPDRENMAVHCSITLWDNWLQNTMKLVLSVSELYSSLQSGRKCVASGRAGTANLNISPPSQ